jgi:hypothetical protein
MKTRSEIAKGLWQSFCASYTRQHVGWMVKVDVYDPSMSRLCGETPSPCLKLMANDLTFQGIALEDRSSRPQLLVTLASNGELFTHRLMRPTHIVAIETASGLHEGLLIHDKTGGLMQIRFREPASAELLDGCIAA